MPIKKLQLHQFRHFEALTYTPGAKINFIVGSNGSGKTSILESVYILSTGRSFRSTSLAQAIYHKEKSFTIHAELTMKHVQSALNVGFQRQREQSAPAIKVNGRRETKIADLAKMFPVKLLQVDNYQLLRNDPQERRQMLDWGVFHVEHSFYPAWQQYQRLLKHRNMLLKTGATFQTLEFWSEQLITAAEEIHIARQAFMTSWQAVLKEFVCNMLKLKGISMEYYPGWANSDAEGIAHALAKNLSQDQRLGYTQIGPHRADLVVKVEDIPAKQRLSIGQQKMLVTALHLSQAYLLMQQAQKETVFLLDDLPAELDSNAQQKIGGVLAQLDAQVLMTCVDSRIVKPFSEFSEVEVFHVEQYHQAKEVFVPDDCFEGENNGN